VVTVAPPEAPLVMITPYHYYQKNQESVPENKKSPARGFFV